MTTPYKSIDCDESAENVSSTPVQLRAVHVINKSASMRYLKLYDQINPVVGTTVPVMTLAIPTSGDVTGGGFTITFAGLEFPDGLAIACTTGVADNDTGAPGANEVVVNLEIGVLHKLSV